MQILNIFPECSIAISSKQDGGIQYTSQIDALLEANTSLKSPHIILPHHQHSTTIVRVGKSDPMELKEIYADGMITDIKEIVLAHILADCVPIILLDRHTHELCTLHAGWRGIVQGIVPIGILTTQLYSKVDLHDVWIWIGPSIQKQSFRSLDPPLQMNFPGWKEYVSQEEDGYHVDLQGFILSQCKQMGVHETHIIVDGRDTYQDQKVFYSFQRSKDEQDPNENQRFMVCAWLR